MRKYGKRTTLPFLLSLSLEYLSYSLRESTSSTPSSKASGPMLPLSSVERAESAKRAKAFWWYLARGPVWESWTKPRLEGMADKFEGKPLIGFVSTLIKDYVPLLDGYYFCESPCLLPPL
jgi:peroxin-16